MTQESRLPAAATAEDQEDIAAGDLERRATEQNGVGVPADGQVDDIDERARVAHRWNAWKKTVNAASMRMRAKRIETTDAVVRRPTPSAPPLVAKPC